MPVIKSLGFQYFLMSFLLVVSTPVSATLVPGYTDIRASSEPELASILEQEYNNSEYGISRIHDYAHDTSVKNTDVEWNFFGQGVTPSFKQIAKHAGYSSRFGMIIEGNFWSFSRFVEAFGTDATIKFHLGIEVTASNDVKYLWSSNGEQNNDGLDHMVTWVVDLTRGIYAVAFEDLPGGGDQDFNDLVLEVRGFVDGPVIPEPATLALLGIGLAGIGARRHDLRDVLPSGCEIPAAT